MLQAAKASVIDAAATVAASLGTVAAAVDTVAVAAADTAAAAGKSGCRRECLLSSHNSLLLFSFSRLLRFGRRFFLPNAAEEE